MLGFRKSGHILYHTVYNIVCVIALMVFEFDLFGISSQTVRNRMYVSQLCVAGIDHFINNFILL